MMKLNDYMKLNYKMEIVEDPDEGGYVIALPELPGCLSTGETIEEAIENIKDAKKVWLDLMIEDGREIPLPESSLDDYSGQFKIRIPKSLHRSLVDHAKREGVSMNQYCVYLLSYNDASVSSKMNKA